MKLCKTGAYMKLFTISFVPLLLIGGYVYASDTEDAAFGAALAVTGGGSAYMGKKFLKQHLPPVESLQRDYCTPETFRNIIRYNDVRRLFKGITAGSAIAGLYGINMMLRKYYTSNQRYY